jgi:hypothetical protein
MWSVGWPAGGASLQMQGPTLGCSTFMAVVMSSARPKPCATCQSARKNCTPNNTVAADEAAFLELAPQTHSGKGGICRQSLPQIRFEAIDDPRRWRTLLVDRRLQAFGDVGSDYLSVYAELPGDSADRQTLAVQIMDHDAFLKASSSTRRH